MTTQPEKLKELAIPFSGFYETCHYAHIDTWIEYEAEFLSQDYGVSDDVVEKITGALHRSNFSAFFPAYAEAYASEFEMWLHEESGHEIKLGFKELESPREYNFRTDEIYCSVSDADILKMFEHTKREDLERVLSERHTSYDGFASFYSNNLVEWGDVLEWDNVQLSSLLIAFMSSTITKDADSGREDLDIHLMEDASGNGYIDDWIYGCLDDKTRKLLDDARENCENASEAGQA